MAIFALGIMPYITASIILQLLTVVIPRLEALKQEGASGTAKITQYTRYLTLVLAIIQATAFTTLAVNDQLFSGCTGVVYDTSVFPVVVMILTMTAGTSIIMWMGELITDRGVGNGMSVMIFTDHRHHLAQFVSVWGTSGPFTFALTCSSASRSSPSWSSWVSSAPDRALRQAHGGKADVRGHVDHIAQGQHGGRHRSSSRRRCSSAHSSFGSPAARRAGRLGADNLGTGTGTWYSLVLRVIVLCYFYVSITFNPVEVADNMKYGASSWHRAGSRQ